MVPDAAPCPGGTTPYEPLTPLHWQKDVEALAAEFNAIFVPHDNTNDREDDMNEPKMNENCAENEYSDNEIKLTFVTEGQEDEDEGDDQYELWHAFIGTILSYICIWFFGSLSTEWSHATADSSANCDLDMDLNVVSGKKRPNGVLVDSGAGASVANSADFPNSRVEPSVGSRKGQHFTGPGKEKLPNRGQFRVELKTEDNRRNNIQFQDAEVLRPILAVSDSVKAGNLVMFDKDESVIMPRNSAEGEKIVKLIEHATSKVKLELQGGVYHLPAWVEIASKGDDKIPFARLGSAR